jgi:hypothetical protein
MEEELNCASPFRLGSAAVGRIKALENEFEMYRQFLQLRCQPVLYAMISRTWRSNVAFFGCGHFRYGENFVRRPHPIHRNRIAVSCWTAQSQRSITTCAASDLDLTASNDFTANKTVAFLIQRAPLPELIEVL